MEVPNNLEGNYGIVEADEFEKNIFKVNNLIEKPIRVKLRLIWRLLEDMF